MGKPDTTVVTPMFRASYPNLFKPRAFSEEQAAKYSVVALFPKGTDLTGIKKAIQAACAKKWGADPKKWPKNLKTPLRKQEERLKEDEETGKSSLPDGYEEGAFFANLSSKEKPGVVDARVQDIIEETEIYGGVWLRAEVNAYAYDNMGNKGVSLGLNHVQKVKDGEAIGGARGKAQDAFSAVVTEGESDSADSIFS